MKKWLSILILVLLLSLSTKICLADIDENKIHGSIELVGYFERINGQEWNLDLNYNFNDKIQIGILENIHQYQEIQEYNTNIYLVYKYEDQLEFYLVPWNSNESPYFKVKYRF